MKEKGLFGLLGERSKEETVKMVKEFIRNIADPAVRQVEFDRLMNSPIALQHAITRMTVYPNELKRLIEKVSEQTEKL